MKWVRVVALVIASAVVGALITLAFVKREAKEEEPAAEAPQRVTVENGEPVIELDAATQQKIGLQTTPVTASGQRVETDIYGSVVDVQEIAAIANQIQSARAQIEQANSKGQADRAQLARLRALNADNKNVSDRVVQEAESNVNADVASAASANAAIQAGISTATQKFGATIAQSIDAQSSLYRDLVGIHRVLIAFAFPEGTPAPQTLHLRSPASIDAHLLAAAPRVDPRLQRPTYFYVAPAGALQAGMNVTARYATPAGSQVAVLPPAALISWQGQDWMYVRRDATHFVRRPAANAKAGDEVVTSGAQQLLSEEMRSQLHEE